MFSSKIHLVYLIALFVQCSRQTDEARRYFHQPDHSPLSEVITYLSSKEKWRDIVFIYQKEYEELVNSFNILNPVFLYHHLINYNTTGKDVSDILHNYVWETDLRKISHFIVLCDINCIRIIMQQINHIDNTGPTQGVLTFKDRWLFLAQNKIPLNLKASLGNITHLDIMTSSSTSNVYLYSAAWKPNGREFELIAKFGAKPFTATWLTKEQIVFPNTKYRLNQRKLTISTNIWDPFVYRVPGNGTNSYGGFCIDLLTALSASLNFSYVLEEPPDGGWGALKNGSWTGIIGELVSKNADLSVAPTGITHERERDMDFSVPYYFEPYTVIFQLPQSGSRHIHLYSKPFSISVWLTIGGSILLISATYWSIRLLQSKYLSVQPDTVSDALLRSIRALLAQGIQGYLQGKDESVKLIIAFWWICCIILGVTYGGNLVAFLTVEKVTVPFKSLDQLVTQDNYHFGTLSDTAFMELLKGSKEGIYKKLWTKIMDFQSSGLPVLSSSHAEHIVRVSTADTHYAYINEVTNSKRTAAQSNCSMFVMPETFFALRYAIGMQNNSVYRPLVDKVVFQLAAGGILDKLTDIHASVSNNCGKSIKVHETKPFTIDNAQGMFLGLFALIAAALMLLFAEIVIHRMQTEINVLRRVRKCVTAFGKGFQTH